MRPNRPSKFRRLQCWFRGHRPIAAGTARIYGQRSRFALCDNCKIQLWGPDGESPRQVFERCGFKVEWWVRKP